MMRRLWVIFSVIIAVFAVIVLALPLGMGLWVQARYPHLISQFNTPHVSYELVNFKRGWFHSRAQLQVTLHSAETTLSGESIPLAQFIVIQNIQHGPFVLHKTLDGSHRWEFARAAMQNQSNADNLSFKADTVWTMANSLNTDLQIKHLLLSNDRQRIEINQLNGQINYMPDDKRFQSRLTLANGSLYESNPEKVGNDIIDLVKVMELDNFTTQLDINKINTLWYGSRHFEAQKIMVFPYGSSSLSIVNFIADLKQSQHDGFTYFGVTNHADNITDGQFKISQLQMALALENMSTPLLEEFARIFMYGSDFQRYKLYSIVVDLFTKGMAVNLSQFQFTTDLGPVALQAHITSAPADPANAGLLHLLENLNVQASANVPKQWLKNNLAAYYQTQKSEDPSLKIDPQRVAQRYLDYWLAHHLLALQDQQVTLTLSYKEGQLLVNGEKPALDNLIANDLPVELK